MFTDHKDCRQLAVPQPRQFTTAWWIQKKPNAAKGNIGPVNTRAGTIHRTQTRREGGGTEQKQSRVMGFPLLHRSISHHRPISHGNYAHHHERLTVKQKLKHPTRVTLIAHRLLSSPQVCRRPAVTSAFFIPRRESDVSGSTRRDMCWEGHSEISVYRLEYCSPTKCCVIFARGN